MKKRPNGSIVNMSSMAGIGGQSSFCAYSASKAAVAGLTRSVAAHCRAQLYKIRCNSIHPDGIATPMVFNMHQDKSAPPAFVREKDPKQQFGRAQVGLPVHNAHHVCRLLLEKNKNT